MAANDDIVYLLRRAIPDALDPIVRRAVGTTIPRRGEGDRFKIAHSGEFSSRVAADLLAFGRNQRLDGALVVIDADVVRAIYYREGRVVGATSDCLFERLGRILRRSGLVDDETAGTMIDREESAGLAAAAALVAPEAAKFGAEARVWEIAAALFLVHGGHFLIVEGEPDLTGAPTVDLSPTDLALEGLRRYDEWRHGSHGTPPPRRRTPDARPPEAPAPSKPALVRLSPDDEFLTHLRALA